MSTSSSIGSYSTLELPSGTFSSGSISSYDYPTELETASKKNKIIGCLDKNKFKNAKGLEIGAVSLIVVGAIASLVFGAPAALVVMRVLPPDFLGSSDYILLLTLASAASIVLSCVGVATKQAIDAVK